MKPIFAVHDTLADAFFGALEQGSIEQVASCFAPDATIWHNFDRKTMTVEQNNRNLQTLFENFPRREYCEVRRLSTPSGFVQQHVLRLHRHDGTIIDWPGCIVFEVAGNRITRLEEYVDIGQLAQGTAASDHA